MEMCGEMCRRFAHTLTFLLGRMGERPLLGYTKILYIVTVVLFLTPVTGRSMQYDVPVCSSLPDHGPENQVSLFVAPVVDHPGVVCARVYNGRPDWIFYGWSYLRLERRWFGLVWSSVLHPKDLFSDRRGYEVQPVVRYVKEKSFSDFFLLSPYDPVHAGSYRVRFRFRLTEQGAEQTVHSETFSIQ